MNSKNALLISLIMLLSYGTVHSEIRTISCIAQAHTLLDSLDDQALVVFDVDETLIVPTDKIQRRHPEGVVETFYNTYFHDTMIDTAYWQYLNSIIWKTLGQMLIEPESTTLIKELQARNIRVIALTHMHAGAYGVIENMEEWRYHQLCNLGIDLAINNNPNTIVFTHLPMGRLNYPVLHKGVFATSRSCTKGQALAAFIEQLQDKPSHIVFFDDLMEHINTMEHEMKLLNIPCTAFNYKGADLIQDPIDEAIALFQYKYLIKHEQWLSDIQAIELMNAHVSQTAAEINSCNT